MNKSIENILRALKPPEDYNFKTSIPVKISIGVITLIIIVLMLPSYKDIDTEYEVGTIWSSEDLIAPFTFPIYKDEQDYENEKREVINNIAPVFTEATPDNAKVKENLRVFFSRLDKILQDAGALKEKNEGDINSESLSGLKEELDVDFSNDEWEKLYALYKNELPTERISYPQLKNQLVQAIGEFSMNNILDYSKSNIPSGKISIKQENAKEQQLEDLQNVFDKPEIINRIKQRVSPLLTSLELIAAVEEIANKFVAENLHYNKELTDIEINNRIAQISRNVGIVRENERIISKHDPINRQTKLKLDSYKKVRLEKIGVQDYFLQFIGKALTVLILLVILVFFLFFIRHWVYNDNYKLVLISSLILLECFFAYISMNIDVKAPVELLIFVSVSSILLTIIFDSRLSFYASVIVCFLIASVRGGDFTIAFISFCGAVLAIYSVRDIKNRSQIFRSFFFILIGNSIAILAVGLDRIEGSERILNNMLFGSINSLMSPVIAYGLLIFYERVFKITTDLTLLELSDFNNPLLRELSSKAPGTFHHSIIMGNLCEAAAEAVGANRILARVGCYYHDIGKIKKPEFYVENQMDKINRHETLNPNISAKIIISHVKDGIELAKEHKLPPEIIDFIPMHHGTTLVSYFYSKAKTQVDANKENVSDYTYRYPGPKPQTKETGIAMLADSIEASTRTIEDPTAQKLESKIIEIIRQRFMEGQLDECDLTLKDLTKIKDAFLKILVGIHHNRIKYPEEKKTGTGAEPKEIIKQVNE